MRRKCDYCSRMEEEDLIIVITDWDGHTAVQKRMCTKCGDKYEDMYSKGTPKRSRIV